MEFIFSYSSNRPTTSLFGLEQKWKSCTKPQQKSLGEKVGAARSEATVAAKELNQTSTSQNRSKS